MVILSINTKDRNRNNFADHVRSKWLIMVMKNMFKHDTSVNS